MLSAVMQKCCDYYDDIPANTIPTILRSAIYSFSATYIYVNSPSITRNLEAPLMAAGVAALSSLIYALTVPIFNDAFGDDRILFHREAMKFIITASLASLAISYITTGKVNLLAVKEFVSIPWNLIASMPETSADILNWLGMPDVADMFRDVYGFFGIRGEPGSSSTFIKVGVFG